MKTKTVVNLTCQVELKGRLCPISKKTKKNCKSYFRLFLDDGRFFFVIGNSDWHQTLLQHLWEYVVVVGIVDYKNKTIDVSNLDSDEKILNSSSLEYFDAYDSDTIYNLVDQIKKGYLISQSS